MTKREKTMMEKVLEEAKEQGFEWYKDNASPLLSIDELLMQAEEEEWQESNDPATAEMTIADFDKEIGKAYIYKVDDRGYLRDRVAAIWKPKKDIIINELEGRRIILTADELEEIDPELLDWITSSKYWGRGYDFVPERSEAIVELRFDEEGVRYYGDFEGSSTQPGEDPSQNQGPWGGDSWEDWTIEQLKKYYELIR